MGFPPGDDAPAEVAGGGVAAEEAAGTGDPRVDQAVRRLDELASLPVSEHPAVFEDVHERLTEVLGDLDVGPGASGDVGGPGGTGR